MCNCEIEADNHYLLESLAACDNKAHNLVITSPLTWLLLITSTCSLNLTIPALIRDRTTYEQPLPINLTFPVFDSSLRDAPTNLKSFMCSYALNKEIFDFEQRHVSTVESSNSSNKNFFSNNYIVDIFIFHFLNNLTNINYLSYLSIL